MHLRAGVVQHVGGHRAAFGLVAVQQPLGRPAGDLGGQLPAEVERVLDAEVEPLPAGRRVDVGRIAGQQHAAGPVALGQPGGVAEARQPARRVHAEVGAGDRLQLPFELVEGRRQRAVPGHARGGDHDAIRPVAERAEAEPLLCLADFGHHRCHRLPRHAHLHLAQQRVDPGRFAGKVDAKQLAHRAAAAVAAGDMARAQPRAIGQFDRDPVAVLLQTGHLAATADFCAEFGGALGQQAIGEGLRDAEDVGMRGVQPPGRGLVDGGEETADRVLLAVREEALQQAALIHDLDAARMQAERAHDRRRPRLLLQHQHVYAVQTQLAGQHQAGGAGAGHDHVGVEGRSFVRSHMHFVTPVRQAAASSGDSAPRRGPCRKPLCGL
ncbi:hypothetical protein U3649_09840 [Luteimonas sp. R10]|nr:hypothetical protein U3649_09840 [Luteimonas sp. R10]